MRVSPTILLGPLQPSVNYCSGSASDPIRLVSGAADAAELVVGRLGLEGLVPPPVGAFAAGSGVGGDRGRGCGRWSGQRPAAHGSTGGIGDDEPVSGSGEGDDSEVVQPVME